MDAHSALIHALAGLGLKPRSTEKIIGTLKSDYGVDVSADSGLLTITQGSTTMNPGQLLKAYAEKFPLDFYGHAGEVRYKSDLPDVGARVAYIQKFGQRSWDALPYNEKSPSAQNVVKPVIAHDGMTAAQWKQLTPKEKSEFISSRGRDGLKIVEAIMARR